MRRGLRLALAVGIVTVSSALPAFAQDMPVVIDLVDFIEEQIGVTPTLLEVDVNDDGIFDFPNIEPEGVEGIWDDLLGAVDQEGEFDAEEYFRRVLPEGFDLEEEGASAIGPCGGAMISYDADFVSIDAAVDWGTDEPPIDIYGKPAFTKGNAFQADTRGYLLYWGFTLEEESFSSEGTLPDVDYGEPQLAFHDHQWNVTIMGFTADNGGDPNQRDKNRNAGMVDMGENVPLKFRALIKGKAGIIDLWGAERLPEFSAPATPPDEPQPDNIDVVADNKVFCFGEGWFEFVGDGLPFFETPALLADALALLGFTGILFNARTALTWRA